MTVVAEARHLSRWYGQVSALNDLTVRVGPGITGLLGPNGAGKSTFLKLLTGQLRPSQGTLDVLGETAWGNPGLFHRIGVCPEQDACYDRMTGREFVTALVRLHGLTETEARRAADEALGLVGLEAAADRRIGGYSKGMRQRVKLAQALAHDPELLVLDEPMTGLDPLQRRHMVALIRARAGAGRHVVVSSHILHEVEALTSSILLLHGGRLLAEGHVTEIRALLDAHPHTVAIRGSDPVALARALLAGCDVRSVRLGPGTLEVETAQADAFYACLTALAASGEVGVVEEVVAADDNLQAVFDYLVRT